MSWSPAGNLLAFISPEERGRTNYYGPLRVLDPAAGKVQVFDPETVNAFFWSPDGRYIAAISVDSAQNDLDITAFGPQKEVQGKMSAQTRSLQLKLTVYDVVTGEGRVLFYFRPTSFFVTQFLPYFDQYALSHRLWSPQSDALVLPVREGSSSQLYIIPLSGGQPRYLAEGSMPSWSQR
jgi:TolB protein